jgi:Poly-beta-hydroxybutyrate polymerase (PhaC) N-terminus
MNNPIPLEYLTSFSQTSQAMMQQLATGLLTSGDNATDFTRYSKLASVQQNYLQQMGALWVNSAFGSGPVQPAKGDRRFASEVWKKSPYHEFLKQSYLVNARYVNDLIERASLDDKDAGKNAFLRTADPGCAEPVELPCDQSPGAPRFPRSSLRPAATSRCAPPEPDLETRGGKS